MMINTNNVDIIGTLVEVETAAGQTRDGKDYIRGTATIKVNEQMIPVEFYSNATTKAGTVSKNYSTFVNLESWLNKRVSVTATIAENKFYSDRNGTLVKVNRLNLRWINLLPANNTTPDKARFSIAGFVAEALKEIYNNQQEVVDYTIKIGQADYKATRPELQNEGKADIITLNLDPKNVKAVQVLQTQYTVGKTIQLEGELNFEVKEEHVITPSDFGEDIVEIHQKSVKRYVITQGVAVTPEKEYSMEDIDKLVRGMQEDDNRILEDQKRKVMGSSVSMGFGATPAAPTQNTGTITPRKLI